MIQEKDTLILGIEHGGKTHKGFTLRPAKVKDTILALQENEMAMTNDQYLGVCVLARQIQIGDIPKADITPDMLMEVYQQDMAIITAANTRLKERIAGFRDKDQAPEETDPGR